MALVSDSSVSMLHTMSLAPEIAHTLIGASAVTFAALPDSDSALTPSVLDQLHLTR